MPNSSAQANQNPHAVLWMTLSTALFSLVFASGKFTGGEVSAIQILFFRYIGGFATLILLIKLKGQTFGAFRSDQPLSHLLRAVCGASGGGAAIHAAAHMPIVDATALGLLQPVFIVLLGVWVLKERVGGRQGVASLACCLGAGIIMADRGAFTDFQVSYLVPAGFALLGAALIALESLLIKTLSARDSPMTVLLYVNGFGVLFLAVPAWLSSSGGGLLLAAGFVFLGPLALFAQFCTIRSYQLASVSLVAPVDYSWLIFAGLLGLFFFGEVPTPITLLGAATIIVAGVVLARVRQPTPGPIP